jgi:hypothetical protein
LTSFTSFFETIAALSVLLLGDHTMIKRFKVALFASTAVALGVASASAQGPGSGGMMDGGWGSGMGWGMGGFGGIGLLLVVLLVAGFALLAVRRRNS